MTPEAQQAFTGLKGAIHLCTNATAAGPLPPIYCGGVSSWGVCNILSQRSSPDQKLHLLLLLSQVDLHGAELCRGGLGATHHQAGVRGVEAFAQGRPTLGGRVDDHRNLKCVETTKKRNSWQARWELFFTRFDYHIIYRPGTKNHKANALSCLHDLQGSPEVTEPVILKANCSSHPEGNRSHNPGGAPGGRTTSQHSSQSTLRPSFSAGVGAHQGPHLTTLLSLGLPLPGRSSARDSGGLANGKMYQVCAQNKSLQSRLAGRLMPRGPWSHLSLDFITGLPESHVYSGIMVVVDRFLKATHLIP